MGPPTIHKAIWPNGVVPNVLDYDAARASFSWDDARADLDGLPGGGGLNIAYEAVDRHAAGPRRDQVAMRWLHRDGRITEATYGELARWTDRFANVLHGLGVAKRDRVFTLLGRVPELYVTVLGTLKNTSVACPLFSAFGPEPIRQRVARGDGRVLVTTPALYRRKVAAIRAALPDLEHVILVRGPPMDCNGEEDTHDFHALMRAASGDFEILPTDPEDMALVHFTSGTTGAPRAPFTSTPRSSPTTPPAPRRSICTTTTCTGAPRTRDG